MSQDRWVLGAVLSSESAWIYVGLGVVGVVLDMSGSPLSWLAVVAIMGFSMVVGLVAPTQVKAVELVYLVRSLIGAIAIYIMTAAQVVPGMLSLDLAWIATLTTGGAEQEYAIRIVSAVLVGSALWWRGGQLAVVEFPADSLGFSFRLGMVVLAIAMMVDISDPADLGTFPMVFIFFAAGLGGLSLGNLRETTRDSAKAQVWPKVITGLVSSVVVIGILFSFLQKGAVDFITAPINFLITTALKVVFFAFVIPIAFVWDRFINFVISLFDRPFNPEEFGEPFRGFQATTTQAALDFAEEEVSQGYGVLETGLAWAFLVVLLALIVYFVAKLVARQMRRYGQRQAQDADERESIIEDAAIAADLGKLLSSLIPDWLTRGQGRARYALPDGPPGVVDALSLYYDILLMAEKRGIDRNPYETATEHQTVLSQMFPEELIRRATRAFNMAFYGGHPAPAEELTQMRTTLSGLRWTEPDR